MAKKTRRLHITPTRVQAGDDIVAVRHITRVSVGRDPVRAKQGGAMLTFAMLAAIGAMVGFGLGQWPAATAAAGFAVLMLIRGLWLMSRRSVFVGTTEGRAFILLDGDDAFMRDVMGIVARMIDANGAPGPSYDVNAAEQQIVRVSVPIGEPDGVGDLNGPDGARGRAVAIAANAVAGDVMTRPTNGAPSPNGAHSTNGAQRPAAGVGGQNAGQAAQRTDVQNQPQAGQQVGWPVHSDQHNANGTGALQAGMGSVQAGQQLGQPQSAKIAANPARPFEDLVARIAPQYGDRFEDVRLWLEPIRLHLATGEGSRAEAQARWSIFAKEHVPALAGIPEVPELAHSVGKSLGVAA